MSWMRNKLKIDYKFKMLDFSCFVQICELLFWFIYGMPDLFWKSSKVPMPLLFFMSRCLCLWCCYTFCNDLKRKMIMSFRVRISYELLILQKRNSLNRMTPSLTKWPTDKQPLLWIRVGSREKKQQSVWENRF